MGMLEKPSFDRKGNLMLLWEVKVQSRLISFTDGVLGKRAKSMHEVNVPEKILTPNRTEISLLPLSGFLVILYLLFSYLCSTRMQIFGLPELCCFLMSTGSEHCVPAFIYFNCLSTG